MPVLKIKNTETNEWMDASYLGGGSGESITVDQKFDSGSENAQSGVAIAQAVADKMDKFGEVEHIESIDETNINLPNVVNFCSQNIINFDVAGVSFLDKPVEIMRTPQRNYDATNKEYVDNLVGDIETALENIITKYGLGGETV